MVGVVVAVAGDVVAVAVVADVDVAEIFVVLSSFQAILVDSRPPRSSTTAVVWKLYSA